MKKMELPPSLRLHNKIIDNEHQNLVNIINDVSDACNAGKVEDGARLLDVFFKAVDLHFQHEEEVLSKINYPGLKDHANYHKKLALEANRLKDFYQTADKSDEAKKKFLLELKLFLFEDALKADMAFKSFLLAAESSDANVSP